MFLVFGLKLVLNMTFNLNETYFSVIFQKIVQIEVFGHFLDFASLVLLILHISSFGSIGSLWKHWGEIY